MDFGFEYLEGAGFELESDYPYKGYDQTCKFDEGKGVCKTTGYEDVETNEDALLKALTETVVSVAVDAQYWSSYGGGIYDGKCTTSLDHGVTLVAAGTEDG